MSVPAMQELDALAVDLRGTRLIEANAGTGKTFTITTLYLRLVMEQGLDVSQILVVTFTNAAAAELRERIRSRLREAASELDRRLAGQDLADRGRDSVLRPLIEACVSRGDPLGERRRLLGALRGFDEAAIFTIHGFCHAVLEENAFESGVSFDTELVADQLPLLEDLAADYWNHALHAAPEPFVRWLRTRSLAGQPRSPELLVRLVREVVAKPDMPVEPAQAPAVDDGVAERWQAAFDALRAQWDQSSDEVIELLASAAEAGDLKKTSYRPETIRERFAQQLSEEFASAAPGLACDEKGRFRHFKASTVRGAATARGTPPEHPFLDACESFAVLDAECLAAFEARWLGLELEAIAWARRELERRRRATRTCSFDDLLSSLAEALRREGGDALAERIGSRFRAAMIDEFQDTDPLQYEIFERIWHRPDTTFFLIGDPKQAIYAFRGADVFAYMQAKRDAGSEAYTLARNWRSSPSLIEAVNRLFERVPQPFLYEGIPYNRARPAPGAEDVMGTRGGRVTPMRVLLLERSAAARPKLLAKGRARQIVPPAVASDIALLLGSQARLGERPLEARDVAVLCRTNAQAREIQSALRERGVPSVLQSDESVFDSPEAAELERLLAAVVAPGDVAALRGALATSLVGASAAELCDLASGDGDWEPWLLRAREWHERWLVQGPLPMLHRVLSACGARTRLLAELGGERRLTNVLHLGELLQGAARTSAARPHALLGWLRRMRRDRRARGDSAAEAAEIRLESDSRAVQIVTIHRSKGLQYGIVYCPYLWDGQPLAPLDREWVRFHDPDADLRLTLDLGSTSRSERARLSAWEAMAEGLRLLYVALTRAEHQLVLVWGGLAGAQASALGHLLHPPPDADRIAPRGDVDPEQLGDHVAGMSDDEIRADLSALEQAADGLVVVEPLAPGATGAAAPSHAAAPPLAARTITRTLASAWRVSSFTGLAAGRHVSRAGADVAAEHPAALGLDYDGEAAGRDVVGVGAGAGDAGRVRLAEFPAGAGPGTLIHRILERADFTAPPDALRTLVVGELSRHGLAERHGDALAAALADVIDTPLGAEAGDLRLAVVERRRRIDEMEFTLPVCEAAGSLLEPATLADVFARHAASPLVRSYAERAAGLGFAPLEGFLRGFVDLVFEHAGRFYVADYKSNKLGVRPDDYLAPQLAQAMTDHDYVLQYHLYAVALHRHLARRLRGYAYDTHFGGVYYLFLRGMAPGHPPGCGIHFDRPPRALVEALSGALAGGDDPVAAHAEAGA